MSVTHASGIGTAPRVTADPDSSDTVPSVSDIPGPNQPAEPEGPPLWASPSWAAPSVPAYGASPPGSQPPPPPPASSGGWSTDPPPAAPPRMRPLGVGEILDGAIKVWRTDFRRLFPWVALFSVPAQLSVAALRLSIPKISASESGGVSGTVSTNDLRAFLGGTFLIVTISVISSLLITAGLTAYLTDRVLDRPTNLNACLRVGLSRLLPLLGAGFLVGLGAGIGIIACIVPGIILFVRWNYASQAVVVERAGPIAAIKRSYWLTAGRFWPLLAIIMLSFILAGIVSSVITGILGAIVAAITHSNRLATSATGFVTGVVASGLTLPFSAAVSVITYLDLRVRREGLDVQLLAQGISPHP